MSIIISFLEENNIKPSSVSNIYCISNRLYIGKSKAKHLYTNIVDYDRYTLVKITYTNNAPKSDVLKECRGIILRYNKITNKYTVVCYPFDRFYNHNDKVAPHVALDIIEEKLDGMIVMLWWNNIEKKWVFSSRKLIYIDRSIKRKLDSYIKKTGFNTNKLSKIYTYIFELCFRGVNMIKYTQQRLVHIGTRSLIPPYRESRYFQFPIDKPRLYTFDSIDAMVNYKEEKIEGFIVVDNDYNRIKVKTSYYRSMNKQETQRMFKMVTNTKISPSMDKDCADIMIMVIDKVSDEIVSLQNKQTYILADPTVSSYIKRYVKHNIIYMSKSDIMDYISDDIYTLLKSKNIKNMVKIHCDEMH